MAPIIIFILLAFISNASTNEIEYKEKPLHIIIPDDPAADEEQICPDESKPWVVMSKKDKRRLELLIRGSKFESDPNLIP